MSKSIDSFLKPMAPLIQKAARLEKISQVLQPLLSPNPSIWQVGNYEQGTLTLLTPDAAYATQLRFLCPHLLTHLRSNAILPDLAQIKIKVTPIKAPPTIKQSKAKPKIKRSYNFDSDDGLEFFEEGPLKELLSKLYSKIDRNP